MIKIGDVALLKHILSEHKFEEDDYYEMMKKSVSFNNLDVLSDIDNVYRSCVVEKYGIFFTDTFKRRINKLLCLTKDAEIFKYLHNRYEYMLIQSSYNDVMYEASYINNLKLFKLASEYGNDWDRSYYEASRVGNKEIMSFISEHCNRGKLTSFQEAVGNFVNKFNQN